MQPQIPQESETSCLTRLTAYVRHVPAYEQGAYDHPNDQSRLVGLWYNDGVEKDAAGEVTRLTCRRPRTIRSKGCLTTALAMTSRYSEPESGIGSDPPRLNAALEGLGYSNGYYRGRFDRVAGGAEYYSTRQWSTAASECSRLDVNGQSGQDTGDAARNPVVNGVDLIWSADAARRTLAGSVARLGSTEVTADVSAPAADLRSEAPVPGLVQVRYQRTDREHPTQHLLAVVVPPDGEVMVLDPNARSTANTACRFADAGAAGPTKSMPGTGYTSLCVGHVARGSSSGAPGQTSGYIPCNAQLLVQVALARAGGLDVAEPSLTCSAASRLRMTGAPKGHVAAASRAYPCGPPASAATSSCVSARPYRRTSLMSPRKWSCGPEPMLSGRSLLRSSTGPAASPTLATGLPSR